MIKGAIFDVDGTILDSLSIWEDAANIYLKKIGITPEPDLTKKIFTMSIKEGAQYMRDKYNIQKSIEEISAETIQVVKEFYYYEAPLKPGVDKLIKLLKEKNLRMTVATSSDKEVVTAAFKRLDILKYFDEIFTCGEIGKGKKFPDIFLKAAEAMGTEVSETIVFEDSLYAIKTVNEAGFKAIGVYDFYSRDEKEEIKKNTIGYIDNYDSLKIVKELLEK